MPSGDEFRVGTKCWFCTELGLFVCLAKHQTNRVFCGKVHSSLLPLLTTPKPPTANLSSPLISIHYLLPHPRPPEPTAQLPLPATAKLCTRCLAATTCSDLPAKLLSLSLGRRYLSPPLGVHCSAAATYHLPPTSGTRRTCHSLMPTSEAQLLRAATSRQPLEPSE